MTVIWLPVALAQIERIEANREAWAESSGKRLAAAMFSRGEQLGAFPNSGRMMPEFQMEHLREVLEQSFRICYEVLADRVEVFGVVSSRQDLFAERD